MTEPSARCVFLDRDGVLCKAIVREGKPYPPESLETMALTDGAADACRRLKAAGFLLICVSNQPDVARGKTSAGAVEAINAALMARLMLDGVRTCMHDDSEKCHCRKPAPGLLTDAARDMHIDLNRSFIVGDRWRDIDCGRAAGCMTVFLDYGYNEKRPDQPHFTCGSLPEAADFILAHTGIAD